LTSTATSWIRRAPWLLALVVTAAGAVYALWLGPDFRYIDEEHYVTLARQLATHGEFSMHGDVPTAYRPPGYPFFLAALERLGLGVVGFRIANFVALGLTILATGAMLSRAASPLAAAVGSLLVAGYPLFFYAAGTLYPQILAMALLAGALLATSRALAQRGLSAGRALGIGAGFGCLVLTIPSFLFTLALTLAWLALRSGLPGRIPKALAIGLAAAAIVLPWTARNYLVLGAFVPVSTNSGVNLLYGNSPDTRPNSGVTADISAYEARADGLSETAQDAFYRSEALAFVRENRAHSLRLYALKWLNYFNFRNELATRSEASSAREWIMLLSYGPLLLLFVARLLGGWRRPLPRFDELLAVLYLGMPFFLAIFFTRIRFRLPFDLCLILLVAPYLARLLAAHPRVPLGRAGATGP